jgi:uncharacterized surface protein with fasciclin (FAS1) repeats
MKTQSINLGSKIKYIVLFCIALTIFSSCKDYMEGKTFLVSDARMIDEYIEQKDTSMSVFLKVADKAGFRGMLHAYGTNTCFIPTNEAIKVYCQRMNIPSLETLPVEDLEKLIKFHIVRDSVKSADFIDGRLKKATMLGKFLTTRTIQDGASETVIRVNRQANILEKDINVANGIIHKIDYILTPNPKTVGEMIEQLPDNYSLFKSIMKETTLTDTLTLNNGKDVWYTVFLQSNESFATQNITDKASLLLKMKAAQPDYADNPVKLMELYAQYHVVNRLAYAADLAVSSAELTRAKNQVITLKSKKDSLIVNEYQSVTTFEKGVTVNKNSEWTDMSCSNGVMIDMDGYIQPVKRGPQAVYWEITDQPEIKKLASYRVPGAAAVTFKPGELSELNFGGKNGPTVVYGHISAYNSNGGQYVNYDYLGVKFYPSIVQWMEIKTPVLTEGVYNVWICWRRVGSPGQTFKSSFKQDGKDDQILPNIIDFAEYFSTTNTPEVNLNIGMKRYNAKVGTSVVCSRLCGAIKVDYTGRHIFRMDAIGGKNQEIPIDMIQFIPVEQDQLWPRFDVAGNAIYPGTACDKIAPYEQTSICNN